MGWLRRTLGAEAGGAGRMVGASAGEATAAPQRPRPSVRTIEMDPSLLSGVADLLAGVENGIGDRSDARIRYGIRAISSRAGSWGLAEQMRNPGGTSEAECGRSFLWLAAAATCAVEADEPILPLRIFYLARFFKDELEPQITMADGDDMRVSLVPSDAMAEILDAALVSLPRLGADASRVVLRLGEVPVEAWALGKMVGERAVQPGYRRLIAPANLELAEQLASMPTPNA